MAADLRMADSCQAAAQTAFEGFFREHFAKVHGLLYRVTGNAQDAEDLSQELFLQLSKREPPVWDTPVAAGWLWKAATHLALNTLRGKRRRVAREDRATRQDLPVRLLSERDQDPAGSLLRKEQRTAVRHALHKLKPQESLLLLARHSGLSYAEVAAALDLNPASVGTLLSRAERRFKDVYQDQEDHHGTHPYAG
ncbi:MAG TPA: sigma-70 family RNA polymerase sigma factor [Chloroflexota bacterium]|nr:sigma-70 family RNA polymerase sigma factor [Chloroflexota bacterium]